MVWKVKWLPGPLGERVRDCKDLDAPYSLPLILAPLLPMRSSRLHTVRVSGRVAIAVVAAQLESDIENNFLKCGRSKWWFRA
jgi:hypothetical protein